MTDNNKLHLNLSDSAKDPIPFELAESLHPSRVWWILGGIVLFLFVLTVFGDLTAESLLGPYAVEGQWIVEARQQATGEDIPLGDWRPGLLVPSQTWLTAQSFRVFGVTIEVARALSGVMALLSAGLFFLLALRASGKTVALWATLLLLSNPVFQAISRMALPSIFSLFWMLLAVWVWNFGRRNAASAFLAGALVAWAGFGENSSNAVFFLGSAGLVMILIRIHSIKMPWRPATSTRLNAATWGMVAVLGVVLVVIITNWVPYGRMWDHFTTFNWRMVVSNLVMAPISLSRAVSQMPVTAFLAVVYFLFFAKLTVRPVARHRQINESRIWFLAWLLVGGVYMIFSSPRLEAQALLVPPLCLLAGEGLVRLAALRKISRPRIDVMIVTLMIFGAVWFGVAWLVREYYDYLPNTFWQRHHIRGTALLVSIFWPLFALVITWSYLKWKKYTISVGSRQVMLSTWLILALAVGRGGYDIGRWALNRTHQVQEASLKLSEFVGEGDLLVGTWAPLLTLDSPARAAMVWSEINDQPSVWHGRVTHLLLVQGRETNPRHPPLKTFSSAGRRLLPVTGTVELGTLNLELHEFGHR